MPTRTQDMLTLMQRVEDGELSRDSREVRAGLALWRARFATSDTSDPLRNMLRDLERVVVERWARGEDVTEADCAPVLALAGSNT